MMVFYGHVGAALIIAGLLKLNPVLTILGAVLPDLDALMFLTGRHWYKYHRKITHSLIMPAIALLIALITPLAVPVFWGVVSHLMVDLIGYPGVMLLYPFNRKKFYILKSKYSKGVKEDTPIIAIKNWLHDRKQLAIESAVVITGILIYLLMP